MERAEIAEDLQKVPDFYGRTANTAINVRYGLYRTGQQLTYLACGAVYVSHLECNAERSNSHPTISEKHSHCQVVLFASPHSTMDGSRLQDISILDVHRLALQQTEQVPHGVINGFPR